MRTPLLKALNETRYSFSSTGSKLYKSQRLGGAYPGYYTEEKNISRTGMPFYFAARIRAKGNNVAFVGAASENRLASKRNANKLDPASLLKLKEARY